PENILALTFTESAAANMRKRLIGLIGPAGYYADICTFHGFCHRLIRESPENFPKIIGSENIGPAGQIALIRKIIEATRLRHLKPFGDKFYYVSEILNALKKLKNEGWSPDYFKKNIASTAAGKTATRQKELALVYQKYQSELARQKLYDFDDMILETLTALKKNKNFLLDLQEKYQYILVDEHQDTNGAQNKTLEFLAGYDNSPNLFVVGDDKQAIFRFQGASLENFLYFKKKYPAVKLIELKSNYRSSQKILDASQSLIEKNTAALASTALRSIQKPAGRKIKIASLDSADAEYLFIAEKIKELTAQKIPAREIAVIYRENKDAPPLADILERQGINHAVESDENILEDIDIKKLNLLMKAVSDFPKTERLAPALHLDFLGLDPLEIYKWLESKTKSTAVLSVIQKIGYWKKLSFNLPFPNFFEAVIKESGFLKNILSQPNYSDRARRLNKLFNEIKKSVRENHDYSLADYLEYLEMLKEHRLPLATKMTALGDSVRLMTAHRAKGLEFETVFITGAYNGHWGNKRKRDILGLAGLISSPGETDPNEDERRLFYMALTRAKKDVYITYSA
ncbi:MAG: ATP-dependent helicase, partial [Candidatus Yanofskybacteria bacterium]|nr:ATP-dependent helicase [Candidatus Yanofskybacteria bacterium]